MVMREENRERGLLLLVVITATQCHSTQSLSALNRYPAWEKAFNFISVIIVPLKSIPCIDFL